MAMPHPGSSATSAACTVTMVEDSKSLDDQYMCGIDRDNEDEMEHAKGSLRGYLGAKKKKKKRNRREKK